AEQGNPFGLLGRGGDGLANASTHVVHRGGDLFARQRLFGIGVTDGRDRFGLFAGGVDQRVDGVGLFFQGARRLARDASHFVRALGQRGGNLALLCARARDLRRRSRDLLRRGFQLLSRFRLFQQALGILAGVPASRVDGFGDLAGSLGLL